MIDREVPYYETVNFLRIETVHISVKETVSMENVWPLTLVPLRLPNRPIEPEGCVPSPDGRQPPAAQQGLELFCDHVPQCRVFEGQLGILPFETAVLVFQLLEVFRL